MHKILSFYNSNRRVIWIAILAIAFTIILLQTLNNDAKKRNLKINTNDEINSSSNTTIYPNNQEDSLSSNYNSEKIQDEKLKDNEKYINYNDMKNILSTELSYNGLFQIIVEKNSNDIIVLLEYTINTTKAYYALRKLNVINDIEESNPGTIKVYNLNPSEFSYDKNKVIHVISDNA